MKLNPNFFVLGAARCGTTSLAHWLSAHPQVFMSPMKEPHHYNTDHNNFSHYRDKATYSSLFNGATNEHVAIGEASPGYILSNCAVSNILQDHPQAKFIVTLRNPVEMAPSAHGQLLLLGYENTKSFDKAWQLQDARRRGNAIPIRCVQPHYLLYKEFCSLGEQVDRLLSLVDRDRLLLLFLEDIKSTPWEVWQQVESFLELPDDGRSEFPAQNAAVERRSHLVALIHDVHNWSRRNIKFPALGTGILEKVNSLNTRPARREPMSQETRDMLIEAFHDDILLLAKRTGRDLSHWLK